MTERELEVEAAVDAYLKELGRPTAPARLEQHILGRLQQDAAYAPRPWGAVWLDWLTSHLWRPALVALVPVIAGFIIGFGSSVPADGELAADMVMLAFSDLYSELADAQP
jgi:hypothetical protein